MVGQIAASMMHRFYEWASDEHRQAWEYHCKGADLDDSPESYRFHDTHELSHVAKSVILSAFFLESYLNERIEHFSLPKNKTHADYLNLRIERKLEILVSVTPGGDIAYLKPQPFNFVSKLFDHRNKLAHYKKEFYDTVMHPCIPVGTARTRAMLTWKESQLALNTVRRIAEFIEEKLPEKHRRKFNPEPPDPNLNHRPPLRPHK